MRLQSTSESHFSFGNLDFLDFENILRSDFGNEKLLDFVFPQKMFYCH